MSEPSTDRTRLSVGVCTPVPKRTTSRIDLGVLGLSLVLTTGALACSWHIGQQANRLDHELFHASANLEGIKHWMSTHRMAQR